MGLERSQGFSINFRQISTIPPPQDGSIRAIQKSVAQNWFYDCVLLYVSFRVFIFKLNYLWAILFKFNYLGPYFNFMLM